MSKKQKELHKANYKTLKKTQEVERPTMIRDKQNQCCYKWPYSVWKAAPCSGHRGLEQTDISLFW